MQKILIFGVLPLVSASLLGILLTYFIRNYAREKGYLCYPETDTYHESPVPLGGGISLLATIILTTALGLVLVRAVGWMQIPALEDLLQPHIPGIFERLKSLGTTLAGGILMFLLGLRDDHRALSPGVKLAGETAVALLVALSGIRITLFLSPGTISSTVVQITVTVVWIVGVTNSFNLLDNMDGICGAITAVITGTLAVLAFQTGQYFLMAFLSTICGACFGFLLFNLPPASVFAGDAGSLTLGYFVAVSMILFTFYRYSTSYPVHVYFSPLILLAIPLYDTLSVILIRLRRGVPIYRGDTSHFSHRLVKFGLSERRALLITTLLVSLTGLFALAAYQTNRLGAVLIVLSTILLLWIIRTFEHSTSRSPDE